MGKNVMNRIFGTLVRLDGTESEPVQLHNHRRQYRPSEPDELPDIGKHLFSNETRRVKSHPGYSSMTKGTRFELFVNTCFTGGGLPQTH